MESQWVQSKMLHYKRARCDLLPAEKPGDYRLEKHGAHDTTSQVKGVPRRTAFCTRNPSITDIILGDKP
jgi:hypothetical protein